MFGLFLFITALAGWIVAGLVNYFSDVVPVMRALSHPVCSHCGVNINWFDYLLLKPCPNRHPRNIRTWLVQALGLIASLYIWTRPPSKIGYILGLILILYFGVVFVIDMEHRLILHITSIFGSLLGLVTGTISHGLYPTLLGGLGGLLIMLTLYYLGVLFARLRTRRLRAMGQQIDDEEALGAGDVILAAVLGLMLGWPLIWFGLLVGILLGGAVSILLILWFVITRQYKKNAWMIFMPYGPYFITSAFLIIFFPKVIAALLPR